MQWRSSVWFLLALLLGFVHSTGGDEAPSTEVAQNDSPAATDSTAVTYQTITTTELPEVFRKSIPESLADLRTIESYTTQLVPRLKECTVNLRIGPAQGSGVLVSEEGLILTAAHVVGRPQRRVSVVMANGDEYIGRVLGRNSTLDAAMVQLESDRKDWPHCELASLEEVVLGDWCLVFGHPGGFQEERGLVTRLGRIVQKSKYYLQSDCELVGGDSGGPIFDMRGRLLGISSRIGEETEANFHVPITAYLEDWDRLLAGEDFRSHSGAYLGLRGDPQPEGLGIKVTEIIPETPAAETDIEVGDIIVTFEAKKVRSIEQLAELVGELIPGELVKVELLRDGKPKTVEIRLGWRLQ